MYLRVKDVSVHYDKAVVLNRVGLEVDVGEIVSLVGPNGAGKSTFLRAVAGLVKWEKDTFKGTMRGKITIEGSVIFDGEEMLGLPAHEIVKRGLILCPERGRPFREMTIKENLEIAAYLCKNKSVIKQSLEGVYRLFPVLQVRQNQISGTVSGGERTMLAIGRALMSQAKVLLVDEPSVGLAPRIKDDLFGRLREVHGMGTTILLIEQDVGFAFNLAKRNYVLSQGKMMKEGTSKELLADEVIRKTYLGL